MEHSYNSIEELIKEKGRIAAAHGRFNRIFQVAPR